MKSNTEKIILESAKEIFIIKGMNGARMQEIADKAKINKALLHYYFRTKENLFDAVLISVFSTFLPEINFLFDKEKTFFQKIELFCEKYISVLEKNPYIPNFIISEAITNPGKIKALFKKSGFKTEKIYKFVSTEMKKNNINNCSPKDLLVNIMSLCIFPIAGKPIITKILFNDNNTDFSLFINKRKKEVSSFIINSLKSSQ